MSDWKNWRPQYDGHAPDDWDGGDVQYLGVQNVWVDVRSSPQWSRVDIYRYRPLQDATHEPDLLAQCLALPQDQREALIEAMQKPQRDWADDVWAKMMAAGNRAADNEEGAVFHESGQVHDVAVADAEKAVIRSMCRPKEVAISDGEIDDLFSRMLRANSPNDARRAFREALS